MVVPKLWAKVHIIFNIYKYFCVFITNCGNLFAYLTKNNGYYHKPIYSAWVRYFNTYSTLSLNQSTSSQPASLKRRVSRVQNKPTCAPIQ